MKKGLLIALVVSLAGLPASAFGASSEPSFKVMPSQKPTESNYNELKSVAAISPTDAFAVGLTRSSKSGSVYRALIEHFSGSSWTISPSASVTATDTTFLNGVSATSASNVWAVGKDLKVCECLPDSHSLIEHFNGTEWTRVSSPAEEPSNATLNGVSADATNDVWAVGESNSTNPHESGPVTLIEHFNGSKWSVVEGAPEYPFSKYNRLVAVDAIAANNVWVAGTTGKRPEPVLQHFNGSSWQVVAQPEHAFEARIEAISGTSSDDVWLVGDADGKSFSEHFNGSEWALVPTPSSGQLSGVVDLGAGGVFVVGHLTAEGAPTKPLIERLIGGSFGVVPSPSIPSSGTLIAVAGLAEGPVFGVGDEGEEPTKAPLTVEN